MVNPGNGNWALNKPLSAGVLLEIVEEAWAPKLVTIMTEHKETVDKYKSTDKAEQKHKYHKYIDSMKQWNNMLQLIQKLLELEACLKCKNDPKTGKNKNKGKIEMIITKGTLN